VLDRQQYYGLIGGIRRHLLFKALSAAVYGIDAHIIDVEVDFSGIRTTEESFSTVGFSSAFLQPA
jgi:hypothetical protein